MRIGCSIISMILSALVAGCGKSSEQFPISRQVSADAKRSTPDQVPESKKIWPPSLTEEEKMRCKEVAWQAAGSRAMWERFSLGRFRPEGVTSKPVKLSETGIQYYLERNRFDTVDVAIPSGGRVGWHPTYIAVTVARGTYDILDMHEGFWP